LGHRLAAQAHGLGSASCWVLGAGRRAATALPRIPPHRSALCGPPSRSAPRESGRRGLAPTRRKPASRSSSSSVASGWVAREPRRCTDGEGWEPWRPALLALTRRLPGSRGFGESTLIR
jgi:hypothetical protein